MRIITMDEWVEQGCPIRIDLRVKTKTQEVQGTYYSCGDRLTYDWASFIPSEHEPEVNDTGTDGTFTFDIRK